MNTYFLIADQTSNSGKEYISDDHSNTGDKTSAKLFKTEEEAKAYITEQNWSDWAYVTTMEAEEKYAI